MFSTSKTRRNDDTEATPRIARRVLLGLGTTTAVIAAVLLAPLTAQAAEPGDDDFLGVVEDYAIVAADTITETATHETTVTGDVALAPGSDQQLLDIQVDGDIEITNTATDTADLDLNEAYVILANTSLTDIVGAVNLAARVTPYGAGVYYSPTDLYLDGEMFLDGGVDDVFIFQASTGSLTVMAGSAVRLLGAVQACNVYWQVGSSATLGVNSEFVGSLLAATSIAAQNGAEVTGQLLAGATNAGAVTLDNNVINAQSGCVRLTEAERVAAEEAEETEETGGTGGTGGTGATGGTGGTGGTTGSSAGTSGGTVLGSRVVAPVGKGFVLTRGGPVVAAPEALADTGDDFNSMLQVSLLLALAGFGAVMYARRQRTEFTG